jgi:hypothetical protein
MHIHCQHANTNTTSDKHHIYTLLDNSRPIHIPYFCCQFSEDNAVKMKQVYGEFCSHHTEAVKVFKELQQQNKKFQVFVKVCF